ncbi:MAG: alanine--tRNA ligase [Anaerolineae bacterium]|nr:alanine--tRNA ligase [Anaerolineae bacterium]
MKQKNSAEIRQAFLDYFNKHGHQIVSSSSLVPGNDPTLLFTNAGMVQFKDVFLGHDKRPYSRATTSQKCMRISGKHNDLENVGPSPRHHTFFEMLGNFSFGDYFKRDAIIFGYELLTEVYGLPADRLAFTVYETDEEAYNVWINEVGVDPKRVARMGPATNFWQMADTGPCGPTSEIHWDKQPELGEDGIIDSLVAEDDRFLELWNLVFMQYNRTQADPAHSGKFDEPLPSPGVDTGMGFERIVSVLQGVDNNYDTDLFTDIMDATQEILGHSDQFRQDNFVAYRVIADHCRAAAFLIADGVNPGTTGREYITRMLIRRALRFAHGMNVDKPFMVDVANEVISKMGGVYPELVQFQEAIRYQIGTEEERFTRTLDQSLAVLESEIEQMKADDIKVMDGKTAFFLFATHGLPLEITRDLLKEHGLSVDDVGFAEEMAKHREESTTVRDDFDNVEIYQDVARLLRESGALGDGVNYDPYDYDNLTFDSTVLAIIKDGERVESAKKGDPVEIVLANTAFYVESGGQVSDTGSIRGDKWEVRIDGMGMPVGGLIVHRGEVIKGTLKAGDTATGSVDSARRWDIMRNHTATHLLHASLRNVLGEHVRQKGSLVAPDRLRFDFTHNAPLTAEEIRAISDEVNAMVLANEPLDIVHKSLDEAKREGAMALFGEKYGQTVRTITIEEPDEQDQRFSYELCGGTHVEMTAEVGTVVITREESSSAGVRRIEAVSGRGALALMQEQMDTLGSAAAILGTDVEMVDKKADELVGELREAYRQIERMKQASAKGSLDDLLASAKEINGVTIVAAQVDAPDGDLLGQMADWCRDRISSGVVMLGSEIEGKVRLVAKVTPDLVERGVHAGKIVGAAAKIVGGGGGGRPDFATAGGKDISKLPEAMAKVEELVAEAVG